VPFSWISPWMKPPVDPEVAASALDALAIHDRQAPWAASDDLTVASLPAYRVSLADTPSPLAEGRAMVRAGSRIVRRIDCAGSAIGGSGRRSDWNICCGTGAF
jgi:hypothetical protein